MNTVPVIVAFTMLVLGTLTACFTRAPLQLSALEKRAALDIRCDKVTTYPVVDDRTRLVRGCGKEAIYVRTCQTWSHDFGADEVNCTWQLDRGPTPLAPAPTAAAAR